MPLTAAAMLDGRVKRRRFLVTIPHPSRLPWRLPCADDDAPIVVAVRTSIRERRAFAQWYRLSCRRIGDANATARQPARFAPLLRIVYEANLHFGLTSGLTGGGRAAGAVPAGGAGEAIGASVGVNSSSGIFPPLTLPSAALYSA